MATPRPAAQPVGEGRNGPGQAMFAPAFAPAPDPGPQVRPMSLKVHYTFDKEAKVNCLARHSHTLHVQTIPIDETNTIGVIDLRACLHAVMECSPELATQDGDYTIYAVDYSELETPLVGQGMLSWALGSMRNDAMPQPPKLVTGRVAKNLLAVFGGGNKETLEVKLKFSESAKVHRHARHGSADFQPTRPVDRLPEQQFADRPVESAMTPTGASEWNSFMQANPQIGHGGPVSRVASPALSQGPAPAPSSLQPFGQHALQQSMPHVIQEVHRVAPTPVVEPAEQPRGSAAPSRPSSRASSRAPRKRQPTGRPRGRPRKKPADGNTSGYEEATEGEEGPARKRATTTKADKSASNPFAAGPESLRVAASTSGSLRNFRPVAASNEGVSGSHLQEIPRAPTPIPEGAPFANLPGRGSNQSKLRQVSALGQHHQGVAAYSDPRLQPLSPGQEDGRSPESQAPTPTYSEDSMASSPPVQRTTPFMSSPPPSSPVLPPMPSTELPHHESSFANDEMDDLFGEESLHPDPGEAMPPRTHPGKSTDSRPMTKGVPIQVFQMQDGPMGQDMVHICSYNGAPHPSSAPPPRRAPAAKKSRAAPVPPPAMEPTPPPTTDAVEKRPSPARAPEPMQGVEQSEEPSNSPPKTCSDTPTTNEMPLQQQDLSSTKLPKRKVPQSSKVKDQMSYQEQPKAPTPPMDAPPPASSPPPARSNKNRVKKHAIKQRLEEAIMNGEMPPFCSNCGAIETPTWRKIWVQEHEGTPQYCEYSEKPGKVTAIEIIKRDADDKPTSYRLIKKSLGPGDDKDAWQELLLCNPCGIWLTKCKCHRPPDRWDKDFSRIGQERRRKGTGGGSSRSRKPRSKSDARINPTSDAYLLTDALGPEEQSSPKAADGGRSHADTTGPLGTQFQAGETCVPSADASGSGGDDETRSNPGSTHSRGSGTAQSPVELEFDNAVGSTRRLLFPSPRKDGALKVLGEVAVNTVQTSDDFQQLKRLAADKENIIMEDGDEASSECRRMEALLKGPMAARPSTPPPNSMALVLSSPFKTPTRTTPSHRPITRSVSRSLRSNRLIASPSQVLLQQTPTKTPRLGLGLSGSASRRRSPRNHQGGFEMFDTPISRSISQAFSDTNHFGLVDDLDLGSLPGLDPTNGALIEFGNMLSTDALMPSSPPRDGSIAFDYRGSASIWAQWTMDHSGSMQLDEEQQED
ncbi:gata transcription factor [Hirsutella rhossiliensis]|uniref:Gata transcription factor n=1 Tax=Hirsutella rhossiliensis TaxID=111463 RepID=A0A9P8SJC6_9HYPO|nr:gata transcription factor [Hirsutella rhossiliensis]KAH0965163.1 gata transcription factor [Hirsutella rhossiliensis]